MRLVPMILMVWLALAPVCQAGLDVGDTIPETLGYTLDGDALTASQFRGKITVMSFWATWCAPCLKELPVLEAIQRQVGPDHLRVLAVNYRQSKRQFRKTTDILKDYELTFAFDKKNRLVRRFGVKSLPHLFIIDRDGEILLEKTGYSEATLPSLVNAINAALLGHDMPTP